MSEVDKEGERQKSKKDTLAEWLRRCPAKAMGSPRESSNLSGVVHFYKFNLFTSLLIDKHHYGL